MLTSVIDSWVFRFVSYTSCDDDATCHPLDRYSNQRNDRYTNDGNAWDFERSFVNFTRLNFQLASKSNGASWFESKNDGIVTGMYYSRWFLKSTLFFKIHRNSKGNIIVYTDRIDADSRYYIFHREILYREERDKISTFTTSFFYYSMGYSHRSVIWYATNISPRDESWRLSPSILRSREPRFLCTFIKFRNSHYPPGYFSQRMHINFRGNGIDRMWLCGHLTISYYYISNIISPAKRWKYY